MDVQITLKNGEKVKVNDHVYCSPTWSIRDGTPYSIARIMEFLPPEDLSTSPRAIAKGKSKENYTRVRLAWYYRPSDVSDRAVADSRLLLAAIYSEVCDISQLRAKCYVIHRDKLSNLSEWKKKPDHFYFHRLFDPYIKKEFEVLLSTDVRNLPRHIKEVLVSRYEYVVAEKEVVPDLTDSLRLCDTCGEWCAHLDAVQCARCKHHFHMSCVSPPLAAKPSRGYGWTCAPCSRRHEDQVDSGQAQSSSSLISAQGGGAGNVNGASDAMTTSSGASTTAVPAGVRIGPNGKPVRGRGRPRKEKPSGIAQLAEEELQVKHYKMWPFRYFGLYTVAEDTLDPNDLIFPRAVTRTGPKYQANVASTLGEPIPQTSGSAGSLASTASGAIADEERGSDSTIEILGLVNEFTPAEVDAMKAHMQKLATRKDFLSSVDWLTEVIRRSSNAYMTKMPLENVSMKSPMRLEKWKKHETRYIDLEWNDEQIAAFEDGIAQFGAELRSVREEVGTRSVPEVVRFYGKWKNGCLRIENERLRNPDAYSKHKSSSAPTQGNATREEDSSVVNIPVNATRSTTYCAACRTRESRTWWKAPKGLATAILCETCGMNWRKYADLSARPSTREENVLANGTTTVGAKTRGAEKREGTPLTNPVAKRPRASTGATAVATSPPPATQHHQQPLNQVHLRCLSCFSAGPPGKVLKCQQCGFRVHAGAVGAVLDLDAALLWVCELCENEKTLDASLTHHCLLCPRPRKNAKKTQYYPPPDTYLRACKPTEGQGWVHVLCSVFIPELQYADASRLRLVEGVSTIPKHRWTRKCDLCNEAGGAVVKCANCPMEYHVSCAWKYGHKFGFEIQPVKSSRREHASTITFKRETGAMNAVICCKDHVSYRRDTYDICDTNDAGETALQVYCRTYKQAPITQSYCLLRKARRLDQILHLAHETATIPTECDEVCAKCDSQFSPAFYPDGDGGVVCHRCHFKATHPNGTAMDITAEA